MTGYGAAEGSVAGGRLRIELRTVNHRFFNFAPKLPPELAALEGDLRERLRQEFERGHVALSVRWLESPSRESAFAVDVPRAEAVATRLQELKTALGLAGEVTLDLVARQPDVLVSRAADSLEIPVSEVEPVLAQAAAECRAMRAREGASLARELLARLDQLGEHGEAIALLAPERVVRERDRLRASVAQLLDGRALDEQRLAQEIAVLADKLDITEELVRFRTHVAACRGALAGSKAVGRQLGFLAQELGREVNTMGSKANDARIQQHVIAMKGELEKFREQLENLE
ncbi:MAG TPA: YicC/YloC family endoribonuclease [Gemmatimonadales bacterium]|nr:YicC/YloC family endoribonuclease [Gemmatimonadales bacterium]